ncbi:MAG: AAA family ATPase [Deltaproteobacteria bacterium]|jgi:type II secretory pathway predicted ATPase ExeA|nr:AAA family ATPase [Deltaproteobacteria bacterium]
MNDSYRTFFGLTKEPFSAELGIKELLETPDLKAVKDRFDYAVRLGAAALVTGEIGSGKSTALRYAAGHLHNSEYCTLHVTATSGSIAELYRQVLDELGASNVSFSRALLLKRIRSEIMELVQGKKINVVLLIDEASLLRLEVLTELHTLCQFEQDSKPWLPLILAGQANLVDKLMYRTSLPLASRIVARSHLEGVNRQGMGDYLKHHLAIAGVKTALFDDTAITAIHQGSGGLFRKANHLARGALIAAAHDQSMAVTAHHVRLASTEIF